MGLSISIYSRAIIRWTSLCQAWAWPMAVPTFDRFVPDWGLVRPYLVRPGDMRAGQGMIWLRRGAVQGWPWDGHSGGQARMLKRFPAVAAAVAAESFTTEQVCKILSTMQDRNKMEDCSSSSLTVLNLDFGGWRKKSGISRGPLVLQSFKSEGFGVLLPVWGDCVWCCMGGLWLLVEIHWERSAPAACAADFAAENTVLACGSRCIWHKYVGWYIYKIVLIIYNLICQWM